MDDLISRKELRNAMYHETFEVDSDLQRWDGGCWIRYKLFENVIDSIPSKQLPANETEVEPIKFMDGVVKRFRCGNCQLNLMYASFGRWDYCPRCGRKVKWK